MRRLSKSYSLVLVFILTISSLIILVGTINIGLAQSGSSEIRRIQGNANGSTFSNAVSVTLLARPQQGDVLIAAVGAGCNGSIIGVNKITEGGVSWSPIYVWDIPSSQVVRPHYPFESFTCEIWIGIVGSEANSSLTIELTNNATYGATCDVCEYSNINTSAPLDQIGGGALECYGKTLPSGYTPPTNQSNELWIGAIWTDAGQQSTAGTGFILMDGSANIYGNSLAFTEQIVNETGRATSNTTISPLSYPSNFIGIIATFRGTSESTPTPTQSPTLTNTPTISPNPTPTPKPTPKPSPIPTPTLKTPTLAFTCISETASSGFIVQIQGSLTYNGVGLSCAGIQLSDSVNGGATWQDLTYVSTDENGSFFCVWNPSVSGNYGIEAKWPGDNEYSNASAVYNFAIAPFSSQGQMVFSVTSNSTLTSLTFDSTTDALSFKVSGPSGTTGVTEVCIPQSLIQDISKVNVTLDGATINYNSVSEGNVSLLTFAYHHSSHNVVISLDSTPTNVSSTNFPIWVILPLLLFVFSFAVIIRHRKTSNLKQ
jgi:hypothetical protein